MADFSELKARFTKLPVRKGPLNDLLHYLDDGTNPAILSEDDVVFCGIKAGVREADMNEILLAFREFQETR